jgi:hypothetical protein
MKDGRVLNNQPRAIKGTVENPMTDEEVEWKALDLMEPIIGGDRAQQVIATVMDLEAVSDVRDLTKLLRRSA